MRITHVEPATESNSAGFAELFGEAREVTFYRVVDDEDGIEYHVYVTDQGEVFSATLVANGVFGDIVAEFCPIPPGSTLVAARVAP